jgi:hypothetical protein
MKRVRCAADGASVPKIAEMAIIVAEIDWCR